MRATLSAADETKKEEQLAAARNMDLVARRAQGLKLELVEARADAAEKSRQLARHRNEVQSDTGAHVVVRRGRAFSFAGSCRRCAASHDQRNRPRAAQCPYNERKRKSVSQLFSFTTDDARRSTSPFLPSLLCVAQRETLAPLEDVHHRTALATNFGIVSYFTLPPTFYSPSHVISALSTLSFAVSHRCRRLATM